MSLDLTPTVQKSCATQQGSVPPVHILAGLTALLPAPLSWTGLLHVYVSAEKSVPGSPAWVQPEAHPCHSCTCISSAGDSRPCPTAGQPLERDGVLAAPGSAARSWPPWLSGSPARRQRGVVPPTFPSTCLSRRISRHSICPPALLKHPVGCRAGALVWLVGEHHPQTCGCVGSAPGELRG